MNWDTVRATAIALITEVGLRVVGAIIIWIIGRWLIGFVSRLLARILQRHRFDVTLSRYIVSAVSVLLTITLVIAILGLFGVQTASFAAVLAALGIAIGMAWSGLLANFAAGVFLVILRPFKVHDFITAGGVTGTVTAIGMFATTFDTPDNVHTVVGNNKILSDNIQNFSANPYRRVDLVAQLADSVDHKAARELLRRGLAQIPNVLKDPVPDIEILQFTAVGPLLAVRPYCANEHYWQVYFDTNRMIRESFGDAGFPAPEQHFVVRSGA